MNTKLQNYTPTVVTPKEPTLPINEIFGPVFQGEGPDIGKPCLFVRVHSCPVQCVGGCDTYFTWDGSEKGKPNTLSEIEARINALLPGNPKVGLVVSGGEPLLYYRSPVLRSVLDIDWQWRGLETSGYAGTAKLDPSAFHSFLNHFSSVSLSPKITPCLHGKQSDEELERNIPDFMDWFNADTSLFFKFVIRDQADVDAVLKCNERHKFSGTFPVYLMPYGNNRDEILKVTEWLLPTCAQNGWAVSPRLQALIWGAERGR
jgi:7-carboxy-7-deazaguanine synthase